MRKTKIIATVGPACEKPEVMAALLQEGVDVFRINASHTNPRSLLRWIAHIRKISKSIGRRVPILVDLQGPRVRTGRNHGGKPQRLTQGKTLFIEIGKTQASRGAIATPCKEFHTMVKAGDHIMMDNGLIELETLEVQEETVKVRVIREGVLGDNKGINLPNAPVTLPALSKEDLGHLNAACKMNVDFIALSFVRSEEDVDILKRWLKKKGKDIPVIAKIEKPRALQHIEAIFSQADGIMIARGDLGIEMGLEKVPPIQKDLIDKSNLKGIPVITATQMLESMISNSYPTRAEVSDIANAVYDGTDAVMLSGETAIGQFPVQAVRIMAETILEAEATDRFSTLTDSFNRDIKVKNPIHAITRAAYLAGRSLAAQAIIVYTVSGKTATLLSKLRPKSKIIALTTNEKVALRLNLLNGLRSRIIRHSANAESMIQAGDRALMRAGLLKKGEMVVILSGKHAFTSARYMTKIHVIGES